MQALWCHYPLKRMLLLRNKETFYDFSGILTGKYKRNESLEAHEGSRIQVAQANPLDFPNLPKADKLNKDDKFWEMMDIMKEAASQHGEY